MLDKFCQRCTVWKCVFTFTISRNSIQLVSDNLLSFRAHVRHDQVAYFNFRHHSNQVCQTFYYILGFLRAIFELLNDSLLTNVTRFAWFSSIFTKIICNHLLSARAIIHAEFWHPIEQVDLVFFLFLWSHSSYVAQVECSVLKKRNSKMHAQLAPSRPPLPDSWT